MQDFAAFAGLINGGVIAGVAAVTKIAVEIVKKFCPKMQGTTTVQVTVWFAFALTLYGMAALGLVVGPWAKSSFVIVLNALLGAAGALGIDTLQNAAGLAKNGLSKV